MDWKFKRAENRKYSRLVGLPLSCAQVGEILSVDLTLNLALTALTHQITTLAYKNCNITASDWTSSPIDTTSVLNSYITARLCCYDLAP